MEDSESTVIQSATEVGPVEVTEVEEERNEVEDEQVTIESEKEEYISLSDNEDPEKKTDYHEYKLLEKSIKYQNEILENLKADIKKMECKPCLTKAEKCDLKNMYDCWQREMSKLQELLRKAIDLQKTDPKRHYREFPIVTTFEEDDLNRTHRTCERLQNQTYKTHAKSPDFRASAGESSEMNMSSSSKGSQMSVSEERKLIKEICVALKECNNLKESKQQEQNHPIQCKERNSLEEIKNNIKCMQQTICKLSEDLNKKENLTCNHESNQKQIVTPSSPAIDPAMLCLHKSLGKANNFQQLKENYLYLLTEFSKKDEQLKELTKKLKNACSKSVKSSDVREGQGDFTPADESELHLLRNRIIEMEEEQVEFKCLMREQSLQLDEYRNKYLTAQQKVEEQCALIEKLNMNNKCIEKQINQEVKEIRGKFQERIADLLQFPKLLENEQIKLAQAFKEKEELESKLVIVCKELKTLKSKQQQTTKSTNDEDCKPLLNKCQQELSQVKKNMEEIQGQRDMFCEQLRTTVEDLNTLRSQSAKIIARTKERAELIKQQQKDQIDRLEKELAQCRATASLSVSDRENVIKEMQGQLNILSYSFDAAQKQIKTLRNHIAYISNENSFPAKNFNGKITT